MTEIMLGSVLFVTLIVGLAFIVMAARAILLPQTAISVGVNGKRDIAAVTGQKLLNVLTDSGINLPSTCGGKGTCGLCRVKITKGADKPLSTEVAGLKAREIAAGMRLACQVVLRDDMAVQIPDELLFVASLDCTVRTNRMIAPFVRELVLELPPDAGFEFHAGAFVQVRVPPHRTAYADFAIDPDYAGAWRDPALRALVAVQRTTVTRAYSIANRPVDAGTVVLDVRLALPPPGTNAPPGLVSSYLFALSPGDRLQITGPYGEFRARESDREMVFIGGGVGMAPLRAIIHDQLERFGTARKISFWYGARSRADLFYEDEFEDLARRYPNFRWAVALSGARPEDGWQGYSGFIHDAVFENYLKDHPAPEDCEYYLCGPPLMIKAVYGMLARLGVDPDDILYDDFGG